MIAIVGDKYMHIYWLSLLYYHNVQIVDNQYQLSKSMNADITLKNLKMQSSTKYIIVAK